MKLVKENQGLTVGSCAVNLLTAFSVTVILVLLFALLLCYSDMSEEWISHGAKAITMFSVAFAGALCAKKGRCRGWLTGGVCGFLYMLVLYTFGYIVFGKAEFDFSSAMRIVYGILSGIVGGIVGINLKK